MKDHDVRKKMKLIAILLAVSTLVSLAFLVFAFTQKNRAEEMELLAKESHALARQEREQCFLETKLLQEEISKRDSIITLLRAGKNQ